MKLSVYKILEQTQVEGPGNRFCIWVQGCSRHCDGCWAKETWNYDNGQFYSVDELFERIKSTQNIEGVTFLGGEPFEQAQALWILAKKIKSLKLSIVTFTGYVLEDLQKLKDENVDNLLSLTDLLIDGPFEQKNFDLNRPWVGSTNKRYIFLTDRYSFDDIKDVKNKIEVRINQNGVIFVNGMGDFNQVKEKLCLHDIYNTL